MNDNISSAFQIAGFLTGLPLSCVRDSSEWMGLKGRQLARVALLVPCSLFLADQMREIFTVVTPTHLNAVNTLGFVILRTLGLFTFEAMDRAKHDRNQVAIARDFFLMGTASSLVWQMALTGSVDVPATIASSLGLLISCVMDACKTQIVRNRFLPLANGVVAVFGGLSHMPGQMASAGFTGLFAAANVLRTDAAARNLVRSMFVGASMVFSQPQKPDQGVIPNTIGRLVPLPPTVFGPRRTTNLTLSHP